MKIKQKILFGLVSIFLIDGSASGMEALVKLSSRSAPSLAHSRPSVRVPLTAMRQAEQYRPLATHHIQPVPHRVDFTRPLVPESRMRLINRNLLPSYSHNRQTLWNSAKVDLIQRSRVGLIPLRFYSSGADIEAEWNKGHIPTTSPVREYSKKDVTTENREVAKIWHFDPVRSLYYYLEEADYVNQTADQGQPIKQDEDMVVYGLKSQKKSQSHKVKSKK